MYKEITYDDFFELMKESGTVFDDYADREVHIYDSPKEVRVLIDEADQYDYFEEEEADRYTFRLYPDYNVIRVYEGDTLAYTFLINIKYN